MSFILNALRKSAQERQSLQPESVTDRILLHQPQQNRGKTAKLWAFLVIINVLMITGIVWFVRNASAPAPNPIDQSVSKSLPAQETRVASNAIAESSHLESPAQEAEHKTTSIAEWVEKQKPEPAPLTVKPGIAKKPAPDTIKKPAIVGKPHLPPQSTPVTTSAAKVEFYPPETIPVKKAAVKNDTPFLNDLPFEFRQTVPKFNINVFVYSEHPEDRFVMIDMIKYKPGQQIKDSMLLKEIRADSLVVVYQNRAFQIERP